MEKIIITVGASSDHFGAYAENCEGIYGAGDTPEEAKQNALESLRLLVKNWKPEDLPGILKGEYEIVYKYDTQSFLKHYKKKTNRNCLASSWRRTYGCGIIVLN